MSFELSVNVRFGELTYAVGVIQTAADDKEAILVFLVSCHIVILHID